MIACEGADDLRTQMTGELANYRTLVTDEIIAAVGAVPRHLFLPDVPLSRAYGLGSVVTHRDASGVALSSATGVTAVAMMLKQLDVRAGHRVLEVGAGTGYNASLLRYLVGPDGLVTTIDIFELAAEEAREHLATAGVNDVVVVHGDGELGVPEGAPYDRIIVTAGADHLPQAWADQLAPGGQLVVPLRINGLTRSVTFEYTGGVWRSLEMNECGFMPMRGSGQTPEHNLSVRGETGVIVRTDGGEPLDPALDGALDYPAVVTWTDVTADHGVFAELDFWLATNPGFARVIMMGGGLNAGLIQPQYDWGSMGAVDGGTLAYLTVRPAATASTDMEIGACGYGPGAASLVGRVVERIAVWDAEMNGTGDQLWIEVHSADAKPAPDSAAMMRVRRRDNEIIVGRGRADEYPADPWPAQPP